jgi:hypothetical protein
MCAAADFGYNRSAVQTWCRYETRRPEAAKGVLRPGETPSIMVLAAMGHPPSQVSTATSVTARRLASHGDIEPPTELVRARPFGSFDPRKSINDTR